MANTKKWAAYYRRFGCIRCGMKNQPSGANGLCARCAALVTQRVKAIVGQMAVARA